MLVLFLPSTAQLLQAQTVEIPFTVTQDGRIWVDVSVGGKTVHALVDTGASMMTVQRDIRITGSQSTTIIAADGRSMEMRVSNEKVCFGGVCGYQDVAQSDQPFTVVPMSILNQWSQVTFDRNRHVIILGR